MNGQGLNKLPVGLGGQAICRSIIGCLILVLPGLAFAQVASDVVCNQCVDRSDIVDSAINAPKIKNATISDKKLADGAVKFGKLGQDVQDRIQVLEAGILSATAYRYIGFSDQSNTGNQGFLTMTDYCKTTFGIDARIATSEEIVRQPNLPAQPDTAFVQPTIVHAFYNNGATSAQLLDASGLSAFTGSLSCGGWSGTGSALVVNGSNYAFSTGDCTVTARRVACSVPLGQ